MRHRHCLGCGDEIVRWRDSYFAYSTRICLICEYRTGSAKAVKK